MFGIVFTYSPTAIPTERGHHTCRYHYQHSSTRCSYYRQESAPQLEVDHSPICMMENWSMIH